MNSSEKNKKGYYSELRGFHRAVPIILGALAVFTAICFITSSTGMLGDGIVSVLSGLFSSGAYAIPLLLLIHAVFYAEDLSKKRLLSRVIFSVIAVLLISSIEYTIVFWGEEHIFAPVRFYNEQSAGGFIGSTVAFCLVKALGSVGIYILTAAIAAIYITFFFSSQNSAFGRAMYTVLGFFTGILALIERGIKKLFGSAKSAKEKKKIKENNKKNRELLNDSFFKVDNGISELKINELGIREDRSDLTARAAKEPEADEIVPEKKETRERKTVNLDYGLEHGMFDAVFSDEKEEPKEEEPPTEIPTPGKNIYGLDESAEKVFTKDFDPFDFALNQKIATKTSSKSVKQESAGIGEINKPLSSMSNDEIEMERQRAEFERKKRMIIEMRSRAGGNSPSQPAPETKPYAQQTAEKAEEAVNTAAAQPAAEKTGETAQMAAAHPSKTVEFNVSNEPSVISRAPAEGSTFKGTFGKQEYREHEVEKAAAHIAEVVAMNNPAYARSANEMYTYMRVTETPTEAVSESAPETQFTENAHVREEQEAYAPVSEVKTEIYEPITEQIARQEAESQTPAESPAYTEASSAFKPYTPPAFDETERADAPIEDSMRMERTMLSPTPSAAAERDKKYTLLSDEMQILEKMEDTEEESESDYSFSFGDETPEEKSEPAVSEDTEDGTVFSFGDEEETEEEEDIYSEMPEEELITGGEIPPEEQNPEVILQRAMFPFLDREDEESEESKDSGGSADITEETADELSESPEITAEEDEDEPPFDIEEPVAAPEPTPIPAPAPAAPAASVAVITEAQAKKEKAEAAKPDYSNYVFPSMDMLGIDEKTVSDNVDEEIQENADKLIETLASFNVTASIKGVDRGPRITRYEVVPAKGVKVSSVMNLQDDIALGLAAEGIRMEAPIPGKSAIGVEIPNIKEETVRLRELLETEDFKNARSKTAICIGKDVTGQPVINDIAKMPHLLIAGATGMGKSVCINSLMISMLYKARPDEVKFIMIDPKQVEFTMYNGIPHLLVPVVSDAKQAAGALMWAVEEMERRYNLLNTQYVRNVDAYNEKVKADPSIGEPMSRIVIVIDEFADLMLQVRDPVENLVMRIAQKARAAGIHLIIGTQRPAVNVITGTIKANIPSRISCKVASNTDSRTVLDAGGAEKLLNKGDMLFSFAGAIKPLRVQGAFVKDSEVEAIMKYLKQFSNGENYDKTVMEEIERAAQKCSKKGGGDDRDDDGDDSSGEGYLNDRQFLDAVELAVNSGKIATSLIQRKLSIGYGKAAKFIDIMEDMGIVGEGNGPKPREVLISADEWREKLARSMID